MAAIRESRKSPGDSPKLAHYSAAEIGIEAVRSYSQALDRGGFGAISYREWSITREALR